MNNASAYQNAGTSSPAPLTLRRNFSWTFLGNVIFAFCNWAMLTVIAKLGTPEMVGQFALGVAVVQPIIMLSQLQLRNIQATDAERRYAFGDFLALRLITTLLALLVIGGVCVYSGYSVHLALVIMIIGLGNALDSLSDVYYGAMQKYERMDRIAISMLVKGPLSLIGVAVGLYLTGDIMWAAVGYPLASMLVVLGYDIPNGSRILKTVSSKNVGDDRDTINRPYWNWGMLRHLVWLALPLGCTTMMNSLNVNISRYMLKHYVGDHQLGIFAALASLVAAGRVVINALGNSASPRLAALFAAGNQRGFAKLLTKLCVMGLILGCLPPLGALIAGRQIITLLYKPEYAAHVDLFVVLLLAGGIGYGATIFGYGMTAAHQFKVQVPYLISVTIVTVVTSRALIPKYGLMGAALGMLAAMIVQCIIGILIMRGIYRQMSPPNDNPIYEYKAASLVEGEASAAEKGL